MPLDIRPDHMEIVRLILRRHVPGQEVWAFGSRVTGRSKKTSDLDLAVIGTAPLGFATLNRLRDDFSESKIPYRVDIVDWATLSDGFRDIISREHVVIQDLQA